MNPCTKHTLKRRFSESSVVQVEGRTFELHPAIKEELCAALDRHTGAGASSRLIQRLTDTKRESLLNRLPEPREKNKLFSAYNSAVPSLAEQIPALTLALEEAGGTHIAGHINAGDWLGGMIRTHIVPGPPHLSLSAELRLSKAERMERCAQFFARSDEDPADKAKPVIPIREVIEECESEGIENGFEVGLSNLRGCYWRGLYDGGSRRGIWLLVSKVMLMHVGDGLAQPLHSVAWPSPICETRPERTNRRRRVNSP